MPGVVGLSDAMIGMMLICWFVYGDVPLTKPTRVMRMSFGNGPADLSYAGLVDAMAGRGRQQRRAIL